MPGIAGLLTNMPRAQAERELLRMLKVMCHERFYETGTWVDEASGVYVGWVERKNSFSDDMPIRSERDEVVLVFSGEEFPEPGTASRLKAKGHTLAPTASDYLVHLYEDDPTFPASLNGQFHGLLVDQKRRRIMLFNDRYGMHRLYYHEAKDALYFAAEAKAILAVRLELRALDFKRLGDYVACGCVLENRSLFQGINVLPPASLWTGRNGSLTQKNFYFRPTEWEEQEPLGLDAYYQEIRRVFSENLPRYFDGREPVGMSLTGGLDTRMIMAWAKPGPGSLPCYSFGGMFHDCRDVVVARQVAGACRQSHSVIPVGQEFLSRFPYWAERTVYLSDGCAAVNRCADLYVNDSARNIAPVRMTGNYGGEVLRRVRAFKPVMPPSDLLCPDLLDRVRQAAATYDNLVRCHPLSFAVFRQAPWHHYGLRALEETQLAVRSPYLDNDFVRTVFRAPERACVSNEVSLRLIADGSAALRQITTDRGVAGNHAALVAAIWRGFLEFTFKAEYAYDYGMPQWLAQVDYVVSPLHLERLFLGRHKFYHYRVWYQDSLSSYIREVLLDGRALGRPYLQRKAVVRMVESHIRGNRNHTVSIHLLLTLELLQRSLVEAQ